MGGVSRRAFCALVAAYATVTTAVPPRGRVSGRAPPTTSDGETVVTNREELETAFNSLSTGDTIRISGENAPYRTTQWLDIDVDGVTVIGPGVQTLIKPADGANVGGIRIGHVDRCHEIDLRGIGFHGNPEGQAEDATRLHGIDVWDATNVTIEGCLVRQTHPLKHGDGGSGISVTKRCSDVRVFDTKIDQYGDRGIQLGGERHLVYGNVITNGLDRPIACDVWPTDESNQQARSVSIVGNLLGNSFEGSLVGIAHNSDRAPRSGYVSIVGNVGFGSHKSFCHVRGPNPLQNISIQSNVSVQDTNELRTEETTKFAGVSVSVSSGRNLAIKNNELHGYSGHGIHVNSNVSDVAIQQNGISDTGLAGIRVVGVGDSSVDGNLVTETSEAGIRLKESANVAVRGNTVRHTGTAGIVTSNGPTMAGHHISENYVAWTSRQVGRDVPGILVRDSGVRVRGNTIPHHDGLAVAERGPARKNLYESNWADGEDPWQIQSPTSRVRDHVPPIDVHRGLTAESGGVVRVEFDRAYAHPPQITFGRVGGAIQDRSFLTDENGDYVGVEIIIDDGSETVDIAVNELS